MSRQNLNTTVLLELLEHFDVAWRRDLEDYVNGERKDDLDSIVINRHLNRTRSALRDLPVQVSDYYLRVKEIIAYMERTLRMSCGCGNGGFDAIFSWDPVGHEY